MRASFPKGTLAIRIREALGPLFGDESFAEAFPARGRPAISPGALAMVSVLQYAEGLSDRQAADQVRARMDWKFLLGLELDDPGFDFSVLGDFRARLVEHGLEEKILDLILERISGLGPAAGVVDGQRERGLVEGPAQYGHARGYGTRRDSGATGPPAPNAEARTRPSLRCST
ncbi:transposase [Kitasatospora aureofaciens]|uniref:transposase n=1 Tax=Kitasatospora aureofaciens TaxID=1894 RepID=UPI0035A9848C